MEIGNLVKFTESGYLATIIEVSKDFGEYAVVWVHGDVSFKNPTYMSTTMLKRTAEVISESR